VQVLPAALIESPLQLQVEVRSCRSAFVDLPVGNPLRPVKRDLRTNQIEAEATDAEHARAYLQFDVHAEWIIDYFLERHHTQRPERGLSCQCFCRFDDVLGAVEAVTLHRDAAVVLVDDPLQMAVYNWTGEEFCGGHYDPVFDAAEGLPPWTLRRPMQGNNSDAAVPPPPQPHSEQRPQKRLRFKQSVAERPAAPKDGAQETAGSRPQLLYDVSSEDFYRMCMHSPMEVLFVIWVFVSVGCLDASLSTFAQPIEREDKQKRNNNNNKRKRN
jgi:hypothetical protein